MFLVFTEVEQLAGISLHSPVRVDITHSDMPPPAICPDQTPSETEEAVFSTPTSLQHHYIIVPSKLRLVTLTSFILLKCKVSTDVHFIIDSTVALCV